MRIIAAAFRRDEAAFTYVVVMIAITMMGLAMTMAARQWKTMMQRELEADLLAKGIEIQTALALYSASKKAGRVMPGEFYPQSLAELTKPPRPFLRKVYQDPIGHGEWQLLRAPAGGIMGVRSTSKSKPIKQSDFPLAVRHFQGKPTHYDWVFQHPSPSMATGLVAPVAPLFPAPGQATLADQSPGLGQTIAPGQSTTPGSVTSPNGTGSTGSVITPPPPNSRP